MLYLLAAGTCLSRPLAQPADLWLWHSASDARITAEGTWVVYVDGWNDQQKATLYSNLRLISSDGKQQRPMTQGPWRDRSPRWSADGKRMAWISDRGGEVQIWMRGFDLGREDTNKDTPLATGNLQPLNFAWSPDGNSIAFTAAIPARSAPPAWAPPALVPFLEPRPAPPVQVFVVPTSGGAPRRLSDDALDFTGEPAWMPNGREVLCAEKGGEIFSFRLADGAARQLTRGGEDSLVHRDPVPSPDGTRIAYTAFAARPQYYAVRNLWVMNADGGRARQLAGTLGRDAKGPQWSNESRTVYFLADDRGSTHVYAARNDGTVRQLTNRAERLRGFSLADNGRAVTVRSSATEGSAVFTFTTDMPAGGWTLVDVDQQLLAGREWGAVEEMPFEAAGKKLQAWVVKPPQFDAARQYPLLLDIGGAPRTMRGTEFSLRAQILAAAGYVVLRVNPRGSAGYGEEFGNLLETQIPSDPAGDLLAAVEHVVAQKYVNPHRVNVSGGALAVWLIGHSGRFSAAVIRGLTASGPLALPTAPISCPTLVVAGANDPAAELLFADLQRQRAKPALVRLPGDPAGKVLELSATIAWLGR